MSVLGAVARSHTSTPATNLTNCWTGATEEVVSALDYTLAACVTLVLIIDIIQFVRLLKISRQTGLAYNGKRVFHLLLGVSLAGRAVFFYISPSICFFPAFPTVQLQIWANHTLEVLFFCAFFMLLIFWMDLITSLRGQGVAPLWQKVLLGLFIMGLVITSVSFCLLFLFWAARDKGRLLVLDMAYAGLVNALEILAAIMFVVFGVILYKLLRKHDQLLTVNVEKKKQMARNIFIVTLLCTLCFSFRVITSLYSLSQEYNGTGIKGFDVPPAVFFLYFFLPEVVGSLLMLLLLRIPRKEAPSTRRATQTNIQDYKRIV